MKTPVHRPNGTMARTTHPAPECKALPPHVLAASKTEDELVSAIVNALAEDSTFPDPEYGTTETGAMRESIGTKIDTDLVPYELVCAAAVGLNYGESKYSARNFEKGLSYKSLCGSIERHNKAIMDGEYIDEDSQLPHYVLLASSIAILTHNIAQNVVVDDRAVAKVGLNAGRVSSWFAAAQDAGNKHRALKAATDARLEAEAHPNV